MKPKTKIQVRVMGLSMALPKITLQHKKWSKKLHDKYVTKSYSKLYCLECNHSWKDELPDWTLKVMEHKCPSCKSELKSIDNAPKFSKYDVFSIITVVEEFQVIRYFTVWKYMSKTELPKYSITETFQEWNTFKEKSKIIVVGLNKTSFNHNGDGFSYGTNFDIKNPYNYWGSYEYNVHPSEVYPGAIVLPKIHRNGFIGDFHNCSPRNLFECTLKYSIPETLLKLNKSKLLFHYIHNRADEIEKYWSQIKICLKHEYQIEDYSLWYDYIEMLVYFKKDINNPKFICPLNLKEAHNEWMIKKRINDERKEAIRNEQEKIKNEKRREMEAMAISLKKKYFKDFTFSDKLITFKVLLKASDFKEEGKKLDHCVYESNYHKKKDSLILSARINDEPIETIEVILSQLKISQARGYDNEPSKYHDRIVKLVEKQLPKIQQLINKQKAEMKPKKKIVKTPKLCQTA